MSVKTHICIFLTIVLVLCKPSLYDSIALFYESRSPVQSCNSKRSQTYYNTFSFEHGTIFDPQHSSHKNEKDVGGGKRVRTENMWHRVLWLLEAWRASNSRKTHKERKILEDDCRPNAKKLWPWSFVVFLKNTMKWTKLRHRPITQCFKIIQNVVFEFWFWHFPPIFVQSKFTCLVTLFDFKFQVFENHFGQF